jgi:starch phosphorylase
MAILGDDPGRSVRMAHLAIVGSHAVNGVARLHTEILRGRVFPEFDAYFPGRFTSKTNGITPRRWLLRCNPALAALVTEAIGDGWVTDLSALAGLAPFADDAQFRSRWAAVKRGRKLALSDATREMTGIPIDPDTLFDCQVKRIHEYKRQLLNILHVIALYHRLRERRSDAEPPRTVIFAGKAAPGYTFAKLVIKLIHAVAARVNDDPEVAGRLRVVFLPNYSVTLAERIFPACELSEQISTAGMEASGTGNMKAALNGSVIIGTLDGATIEIRDSVGADAVFSFGHTAEEIEALRRRGYLPRVWMEENAELARVMRMIGELSPGGLFQPILDALLGTDRFFHCADFAAYVECQARVADTYRNPDDWTRLSIRNVAGMGPFSSDRTVREYARDIWQVEAVPVSLESPGGAG